MGLAKGAQAWWVRGPGGLGLAALEAAAGVTATRLSGRAGGEGLGARSWGVWLLVGLAGLCEAQLCPEL